MVKTYKEKSQEIINLIGIAGLCLSIGVVGGALAGNSRGRGQVAQEVTSLVDRYTNSLANYQKVLDAHKDDVSSKVTSLCITEELSRLEDINRKVSGYLPAQAGAQN